MRSTGVENRFAGGVTESDTADSSVAQYWKISLWCIEGN